MAEAVIASASRIAEKERLKEVLEVKIMLGELQQIEMDILEFALAQLKPSLFKNAKFVIEKAQAELRCRVCGHRWDFGGINLDKDAREAVHFVPDIAHAYVKCPKCGSADFEILQGRGIWLENVQGVKKE